MAPTRRTVLALAGSLLGAGCSTAPGTGTQSTSPTDTESPQTSTDRTTTDDPTTATRTPGPVTVSQLTVTPGVVSRNTPDSIAVYGARGQQYVVASVEAASTRGPKREAFALETDAGTLTPAPPEEVVGMSQTLRGYGQAYDRTSGWIAFEVVKPLETSTATLTWPDGETTLSEAAVSRLARPPTDFAVREISAPETVRPDEDATLSVTVENTGDVAGTWIGALNRSGPAIASIPVTAIAVDVEPGESTTWTHTNTPDDRYEQREGTMTFRLDWRTGSEARDVVIAANS